jgi:hydrogenase-4 component F
VLQRLPLSGALFLVGFLAITGSPPFAPFVSEFSLLAAAFRQERFVEGTLYAFFLLVVFLGFGATVTSMVFGKPSPASESTPIHDSLATSWPILGFAALVLLLGVYLPPPLATLLRDAAAFLENSH